MGAVSGGAAEERAGIHQGQVGTRHAPTPAPCQCRPPWGQSGMDSVLPKSMSTGTSEDDLTSKLER